VIEIEQLRYVRLGTRNLPAAIDFAQRILGLQLIEKTDEQATFRSDFRDHTLVYEAGDPSQQSIGLELRSHAALERAVAALAAHGITATAGDAAPGPYRWAAYRVDAACVYTNTAPAGSYRAFGATHLQWIGESQVDEVARSAGLDPLEVRRSNLLTPGEEVRSGGKRLDADLLGDVEKVAVGSAAGRHEQYFGLDPLSS